MALSDVRREIEAARRQRSCARLDRALSLLDECEREQAIAQAERRALLLLIDWFIVLPSSGD